MPKRNIDYSKTVIYKIVCNDVDVKDLYVGSTTNFTRRKWEHKSSSNNPNDRRHHLKIYKIINANGGWENWSMIEIDKYPCKDGNEARSKERYWLEQLKASMNTEVPSRSRKERYENNKEHILEYSKEYYRNNKEEINKKHTEYHKEYYRLNREKILQQQRDYDRRKRTGQLNM